MRSGEQLVCVKIDEVFEDLGIDSDLTAHSRKERFRRFLRDVFADHGTIWDPIAYQLDKACLRSFKCLRVGEPAASILSRHELRNHRSSL
jgi:hypothetical protein